jgi:YD repeat-containing protein
MLGFITRCQFRLALAFCILIVIASQSLCGQIAGGYGSTRPESCSPNVGSFLSYSYDDADRLIGVTDNLGNNIAYTLNGNGDRISEVTKDPANVLAMTMGRARQMRSALTPTMAMVMRKALSIQI